MISVILPTRNDGEYIRGTVESLLNQNTEAEFEIIVINDGSTDSTSETIRQITSDRLKYAEHSKSRGVVVSRNRGIEKAGGDILVFTVGDARAPETFLEAHRRRLEDRSVAGIVGQVIINRPASRDFFISYLNRTRGGAAYSTEDPLPPHVITFTNFSVRSNVMREAGGFDEGFRGYGGHELDMAIRMRKKTTGKFLYAPEALTKRENYRPFPKTRAKFHEFGSGNLPYLLEKYPDYRTHYHTTVPDKVPTISSLFLGIFESLLEFSIPVDDRGRITGWSSLVPKVMKYSLVKLSLATALLSGYIERIK